MRAGAGYASVRAPRAADPTRLQDLSGATMGTSWSLRFDNPAMLPLDGVRAAVEAAFARVISQMSTWEPQADICRFNSAAARTTHVLAPEFLQVMDCALKWAQASDGAIDPTVGKLVGLWGFGAQAQPPGHSQAMAIEAARQSVGWRRLQFDREAATIHQPGDLVLDLSGIAKGFAVDLACAALEDLGLNNFLMEVGGELRASGTRPGGQPWRIQVQAADGVSIPLALSDVSVATSGDRWHRHAFDGRDWSHTIDPRSGRPADSNLAAVSVLHPLCMDADALATLLTVMGPVDGMAFARQHEVAALFVTRERNGSFTHVASPHWPGGRAAA